MKNENLSVTFQLEKKTLYFISCKIPRLSSVKEGILKRLILLHYDCNIILKDKKHFIGKCVTKKKKRQKFPRSSSADIFVKAKQHFCSLNPLFMQHALKQHILY